MAEPTSKAATDPSGEALRDGQLQLKKRARRRLVGAIALALLAVIVLPMVMDQEPKPLSQDIQIRIPSQDTSAVSTLTRSVTGKPVPTPLPALPKPAEPIAPVSPAALPAAAAAPVAKPDASADGKPAAKAEAAKAPAAAALPAKPPETKPEAKTDAKPAPVDKPAEKSPPPERKAESAAKPASAEQWVVQLGAYQDQANVKSMQHRLKGLGLPSFTEKVETPQGPRTRVRSGPFASRAAAEKAQAQLKKLAIGAPAGGVVAQKQ